MPVAQRDREWREGVTGATSNPTIVAKIVGQGNSDGRISELVRQRLTDDQIAWQVDDELVRSAQRVFLPVWEQTKGDDGYVSFELDPLIEDEAAGLVRSERVNRYLELGKKWSAGHKNRMIKVPATDAGLEALEPLAAAGVSINVTLMFTERQYRAARDAIWRGARRRAQGLNDFKSVYSIFISRIDVYTDKHVPGLSGEAQGQVGIATAKRVWQLNTPMLCPVSFASRRYICWASHVTRKFAEAQVGSIRRCEASCRVWLLDAVIRNSFRTPCHLVRGILHSRMRTRPLTTRRIHVVTLG